MKQALVWICLGLLPILADTPTRFAEGNVLYSQRDFAGALEAFESIEGVSPEVDYNIGNTLMRLGRKEEAIARYRRAQWLAPHDPDIQANLKRAVEQQSVSFPDIPVWRKLSGWGGPGTWQAVFLTLCWLTGGAGIACAVWPKARVNAIWILPPAGVGVLLCGLGVWSSLPSHFTQEAVIAEQDAVTRFEPLPDATEKAKLPSGTVVQLLETQRDWVRIQSGDHTGWIEAEDLVTL